MTASVVVSQNQRKKGVWWAFPFHQLLSTVGISVLAALNYFRCLISLASSLDPDRNALFSNTDSAGILHRIRSPALSSSLADEVDLGASFLDLMYFLRSDASTTSWPDTALFRLGLQARTSLFRPASSYTAFLYCSIIFLGRISKQDNSKA
jgi:hypothetical protein